MPTYIRSGFWEKAAKGFKGWLNLDDLIESLAGGGSFASLTGAPTDNAALTTSLGLKSPLASPTFTGVPLAPTAAPGTNTTQIASTAFVTAAVTAGGSGISGLTTDFIPYANSASTIANSTLKYATSSVLPTYKSFQATAQLANAPLTAVLEIINVGNILSQSDDIIINNVGFANISGRGLMYRNLQWSVALAKYITPLQTASAYGSSAFETGGEGASLHASAVGVNFGDVKTMGLLVSASGPRGLTGVTSGYYTQTLNTLFARYESTITNPPYYTWNVPTSSNPMVWLMSEEIKGTAGTALFNEYLKLGTYSSNATAYGAMNFESASGTFNAKTIIVTNKVVGAIGSLSYDGAAYQRTASIEFMTKGTIASGVVGQAIRFSTGLTTTASSTLKFEIGHDGLIRIFSSEFRIDNPALYTAIPSYSAFARFGNPISTSTNMQIQSASTVTAGLMITGLSTTSTAATATALFLTGLLGANAPTAPAVIFQSLKHNATTSATDLAATEISFQFRNNAAVLIEILGSGRTGVGVTTPTAMLHLKAGTATASTAPLKLSSGTSLTTAEAGAFEYNGTDLFFTKSGTTRGNVMVATAVTTETIVSDRTLTVTFNGTTYRLLAIA